MIHSNLYKNTLILKAAQGKPVSRVPVWLMRQAGRVLPPYRKLRAKFKDFKTLVETPELAAEISLLPVELLDVDAAIVFSDILVLAQAMGLPYQITESRGPYFEKIIRTEKDLDIIKENIEDKLDFVNQTIRICKRELNGKVPLIGFAGAPWTIFVYMTEGQGTKTFSQAKKMLYTNPLLSEKLLKMITNATIQYLKNQVKSGADLIQIFDSWGGVLSPEQYNVFSLKYIDRICIALQKSDPSVPIIVFAKGAYFARKVLSELKCQVIGIDWNMNLRESRAIIGTHKTLQGNLDPCALYSDFKTIRKLTAKMIDDAGSSKYIANLGHGLYPDTNIENVKCFIEAVREYKFRTS